MSGSEEEHDIYWKWRVLAGTVSTIKELCDKRNFNVWQYARDVERLVTRDVVEEALEI